MEVRNLEALKSLLLGGANVDEVDEEVGIPSICAMAMDNIDAARLLLAKEVDKSPHPAIPGGQRSRSHPSQAIRPLFDISWNVVDIESQRHV